MPGAAAEESIADTIGPLKLSENDFIISYSAPVQLQVKNKRFTGDSSSQKQIDEFYTKIAKELFLSKLKDIDPNLEIYGATSVCLFARLKPSKDSSGFISRELQFKSGATRVQGIKEIKPNYSIKVALPVSSLPAASEAAEAKWDILKICNSSKPNGNYNHAWVLDTGIDPGHTDLNIDLAYSGSYVPGESLTDVVGHGTHVSGIIGAKANGVGMLGVAPNAPIRALKIINKNNSIVFRDYLRALQYVATNARRGEVMNLSFVRGFGPDDDVTLINQIAANGVFVTIAAGNASNMPSGIAVDIDTYMYNGKTGVYPACINGNNIFTVSAFDEQSVDASFANFGNSVDFTMPGVNINSTTIGNAYGDKSGTSMAAPHLAGLLLVTNGALRSPGGVLCTHNGKTYKIAHE